MDSPNSQIETLIDDHVSQSFSFHPPKQFTKNKSSLISTSINRKPKVHPQRPEMARPQSVENQFMVRATNIRKKEANVDDRYIKDLKRASRTT